MNFSHKSAPIRRLPDSELEVMQAVWRCDPPVMRADIENIVNEVHPMALTTLLTLLTRLADKGFLSIQKEGRSSCYIPLISQRDYLASQSKRFIDQICGGSISAFATALCDSGISKEELAELKELLERNAL